MVGILILLACIAYLNHNDETSRLTIMYPHAAYAPHLVVPSDHALQFVNRFGFNFTEIRQ